MTVKTLKNYLDAIEDDSIEVKIRLGYYRDTLDVLEATFKGTPTTVLHCGGKEIITSKYEKDTLYLGNKPYMEDYVQCVKDSILTVARLNRDTIPINSEIDRMEYELYQKLKEKFKS